MNATARSWGQRALTGALLVTLALAFAAFRWPAGGDPSPAGTQRSAPPAPAQSGPAPDRVAAVASDRIELEAFEHRRRLSGGAARVQDAFAAAAWDGAPAASAPPAGPAPPRVAATAPPPPFRFLGRYDDGATATVALLAGERVYIASAGHVIDGTWRLDRLGPQELELTYLPLQLKQTMSTGE